MNINPVNSVNNVYNKKAEKNNKAKSAPAFKGLMNIPGAVMKWVEDGGFVTSFLIQDTAGMTLPRSYEGLYRGIDEDKRKQTSFKDLNFKEGAEVAIREGLSGPFMMFTPMAVLALGGALLGKSTFVNSGLIKRLGNQFKNVVKESSHEKVSELKKDFYKKTLKDIVKTTTNSSNEKAEEKLVDGALEKLDLIDRIKEKRSKIPFYNILKRRKYGKLADKKMGEIIQDFNNFHKTYSSDLDMVNRVKYDGEVYSTEKVMDGMRRYAHDVTRGKNVADITEKYTEGVKNKSIAGRHFVNAMAAASTIGSLSIVPLLYKIVNPVSPAAMSAAKPGTSVEPKPQPEKAASEKTGKNVSFKGKWDGLVKRFEFNGNQLTPELMTSLAGVGLIVPRVNTAIKRAPEDPVTKKKDYSEVPEVLTRDIISTGAVTFGVPMLAKGIISSYEGASGFALQNKPKEKMTTFKRIVDKLNPFSAYSYYGLKDLDQIYGNVDTAEKLGNMSKFVDENGGHLARVFKTSKDTVNVLEQEGLDIKELAKQKDRKAANKVIMEKLQLPEVAQKVVDALKPENGKANVLQKRARSLNSMVSMAATFLLVPAFLGIVLPRLVYSMTEKRHKKTEALAMAQGTASVAENKPNDKSENSDVNYSSLKKISNQTFQQLKHK